MNTTHHTDNPSDYLSSIADQLRSLRGHMVEWNAGLLLKAAMERGAFGEAKYVTLRGVFLNRYPLTHTMHWLEKNPAYRPKGYSAREEWNGRGCDGQYMPATLAWLADVVEAAGRAGGGQASEPEITDTARRAFDLVPHAPKGILGDALAQQVGVTGGYLRKAIVPMLKRRGVVNRRGHGYQKPKPPM